MKRNVTASRRLSEFYNDRATLFYYCNEHKE